MNDGQNQYLYDAEGRLCAVGNGYGGTGYLYDAAGNRVAKGTISSWSCDPTTNGFTATRSYVVGPSGEQLTEVAGSFDGGGYTWEHTNVYAGGELSFHIDDPLGTRRAQANSSGMLDAVYQSLPFGDGYSWNSTLGYDPTENHFTGKERDTETGNDYMFARYYDSATGRFLSPDWSAKVAPVPYAKLDNPQSLNLYSYVYNNPLAKNDPDGHVAAGSGCRQGKEKCDAVTKKSNANFDRQVHAEIQDIKDHPVRTAVNVGVQVGLAVVTEGLSAELQEAAATLRAARLAAKGAEVTETGLSTIRYTQEGESFLRYESGNPAFSRVTSSGGLQPGTFAAPASDGVQSTGALNDLYNLPNPEIQRGSYFQVNPAEGTPVIGPRSVVGGSGNEVIFPAGTGPGSVGPQLPTPTGQ